MGDTRPSWVIRSKHHGDHREDIDCRVGSKPSPDPIYPAYVVGDSDNVVEKIRVAAVTKPKSTPDQVEDLLRRSGSGRSSGSRGSDGGTIAAASGGGDRVASRCL